MIRMPILLIWNLLRNLLQLPFNLLRLLFRVPKGSMVHIEIHKGLLRWEQHSFLSWWSDEPEDLTLAEWKLHLEKLASSKRVDGIICEIHQLSGGWPMIEELRGLLQTFRDKEKAVVLYCHDIGPGEFYLSSVASKFIASPAANVHLSTPAANLLFFGDTLKMVGVKPHFYAVGEHKTAPELFTRGFPTAVNREDIQRSLAEYRENFFGQISQSRSIDRQQLETHFEAGIFTIEQIHSLGLLDAVRYMDRVAEYLKAEAPEAFEEIEMPHLFPKALPAPKKTHPAAESSDLKEAQTTPPHELAESSSQDDENSATPNGTSAKAPVPEETPDTTETPAPVETASVEEKPDTQESHASTEPASATTKEDESEEDEEEDEDDKKVPLLYLSDFYAKSPKLWKWTPLRRKPQIAVIPIEGTIRDESGNGIKREEEAVRDAIIESIEEAQESGRVKGAIIYIDSRGGSAHASEAIWWAVKQLGKEKPVIAFMDNYAASGGYYIAVAADTIIASPWTITGSIGVFGGKFVVHELMQRLQIRHSAVGETPGSRLYSPFTPPGPEEDRKIEDQLALFYKRFLARVGESRDMHVDDVHELAQGKVYFGHKAQEIGLVDSCGTFQDAYEKIRALAEIKRESELLVCKASPGISRLGFLRGAAALRATPAHWLDEHRSILQMLAKGDLIAWHDTLHFHPPRLDHPELAKWLLPIK